MPDSSLRGTWYFSTIVIQLLATAQEWRQGWIAFSRGGKCFLPKKERIGNASCPRLSWSKRTAFQGAERRCKREWDALPWLKCQPLGWRKGQVWAEKENSFLPNSIKYLPVILERRKNAVGNIVIKKYGKEWRIRAELAKYKYFSRPPCPFALHRGYFSSLSVL